MPFSPQIAFLLLPPPPLEAWACGGCIWKFSKGTSDAEDLGEALENIEIEVAFDERSDELILKR